MMFSWSMVSIIVLLCQGLVFENGDSDSATSVFSVLLCILILGGFGYHLKRILEKLFRKKPKHIELTAAISDMVSQETLRELFQLHSEYKLQVQGTLEVNVQRMLKITSRCGTNDVALEHENIRRFLEAVDSEKSLVHQESMRTSGTQTLQSF
jgi:hypothetical protein